MISIFILFLIMYLLMAFFAGSEMAFLSCNKLKVKHLADQGHRAALVVHHFQKDPRHILTTILIGTNLAHVTMASLFTYAMKEYVGISKEWLDTLILVPFVVIFAETIPKDWFRQKADDFIYLVAPVLLFFEHIFSPFSGVILWFSDFLVGIMQPNAKSTLFVTKNEFRLVVDESARGGVLSEHEKRLIHTILDLGSTTVSEVMTPLKLVPQLELSKKVFDAKELAKKTNQPIILIYEEIPSIVVGVVYVFDILFEENPDAGLKQYLRPPLFISQELSVEKTIFLLQSKHSSYAAVTNADREVVGVVEIENLIRF
ncbi:MAG: DUF21 domain-containing protein [Candidatus Omnitrophica bacterium]|nr:DUF21 domain-containing protein [Candidatus Omnitrophota bacterium]